jgi:hypothetical protein
LAAAKLGRKPFAAAILEMDDAIVLPIDVRNEGEIQGVTRLEKLGAHWCDIGHA